MLVPFAGSSYMGTQAKKLLNMQETSANWIPQRVLEGLYFRSVALIITG